MDYDTWIMIEQDRINMEGKDNGEEEECFTCHAAPCRCDAIYDAWREDGAYI